MERFNMNYSDKYIPIPSKEEYKMQLISKTEKFIKRMRWKILEILGNLHSDKITFGFKSRNCPPIVQELKNFENELMFMIKNIQLTEKLFISNATGDDKCLSKKTEFINKCRHQNKLLLKNVKDSMD